MESNEEKEGLVNDLRQKVNELNSLIEKAENIGLDILISQPFFCRSKTLPHRLIICKITETTEY